MKINNEFTVTAPVEETWRTLLDIQRVAGCLPGASVEPTDEEGVFKGRMRVKLGAVTGDYTGVARIGELDEDGRVAVFDVRGKELRGQGTASASIVNRLSEHGDGTRVNVETELNISGRHAQFGRGLMADVAGSVLAEFAQRLEREIISPVAGNAAMNGRAAEAQSHSSTAATSGVEPTGNAGPIESEALDLGSAVWLPVAKRAVPVLAGVGLFALLVALSARRRSSRPTMALRVRL